MGEWAGLAQLVDEAAAVVAATCDQQRRPVLGRAWGPTLDASGRQLTVCVEAPAGGAMARNLLTGVPVAITLARLTSHRSVQCKGPLVQVVAPSSGALSAVTEHVERFVAEGAKAGMPSWFARGLVGRELLTVTIDVAVVTDETPGAGIGRPL